MIKTSPIPLRPVEVGWECKRSGDCCRQVKQVVMTHQEADVVRRVADPAISLEFIPINMRFTALRAAPCPLLKFESGKASCSIWEHRPYNCRRFGCYRPDPGIELFEQDEEWLGCANLRDRMLSSRDVRRDYAQRQRKAARWAIKHGWPQV